MPRVEIATQGWGWVADQFGNCRPGVQVWIKDADGNNVQINTALTGSGTIGQPLLTDAYGLIPGFIAAGSYTLTLDDTTKTVEAVSGTVSGGGGGIVDETDPIATAALTAHEADTTSVHGIANTANLVLTDDARLSDARTPTAHTHPASDIASGTIATARLGSGTPDGTTFLRGDQTWAAPAGGGGGGDTLTTGFPPNLVSLLPWWAPTTTVTPTLGNAYWHRVYTPRAGTIREVLVPIQLSSGNITVGITSSSGNVWQSGSVPCPSAGWGIVGTANASVTANQVLYIGVSQDNTTMRWYGYNVNFSQTLLRVPVSLFPEPLDVRSSHELGWNVSGTTFPSVSGSGSAGTLNVIPVMFRLE